MRYCQENKKECALAHSRAEARLPRQPSTLAPSAHPRGVFLSYGNEVSYTTKKAVCPAQHLSMPAKTHGFFIHDNRMFAERAFYCCSCRIEVFSYSPPFSNHFEVVLSMNYASDFQ